MPQRERTSCRRCSAVIETSEKALAVFMFCQTAGIKPRRKSSAPVMYICPPCAIVMAGKLPPEERDFFNFSAYVMIRNLVGLQRPEVREAFEQMFALVIEREGRLSDADFNALPIGEILAPVRQLKQAS